jgi:hypothetical protein
MPILFIKISIYRIRMQVISYISHKIFVCYGCVCEAF